MQQDKRTNLIGIDPGATGCMAVIDADRNVSFVDFVKGGLPTYIRYLTFNGSSALMIAVERVHAMPGQGVSSTFSFGQRLGELEGVLQALSLPYQLVSPKNWQKTCGIIMPAKAKPLQRKKASYDVMRKLYPKAELLGPKGGVVSGRVDALGIAHHVLLTQIKG